MKSLNNDYQIFALRIFVHEFVKRADQWLAKGVYENAKGVQGNPRGIPLQGNNAMLVHFIRSKFNYDVRCRTQIFVTTMDLLIKLSMEYQ